MTTLSSRPDLRRRWPLVGRHDVMSRIDATLTAGTADAVVLCGASGVGKTRLMEEYVDGCGPGPVLRVAASRSAAAIPLAALADLLGDADGPSVPPTGADPAALVTDVHRRVARLARGRRMLVAVDDLTWLDPMSAFVLASLVSARGTRMVATARDGEPLPDAVQALWTAGRAVRLDVAPLDADQLGALLEQVLGGSVSPSAAQALHGTSGGLPLHARELVAGAVEAGELVETAGVWRLADERRRLVSTTSGLRDLLLSRIDDQEPADRDVLDRLAVCDTLRLGDFPTEVTDHVVRLEAAGLLETVDPHDPDPRLRLAHPQLTGVLRERLPRLRTRSLLLEHAHLLESGPPDRDDPVRTAQWRLEATGTGDPALLIRAAHLALAVHDHASVERLADAALASARRRVPTSPPDATAPDAIASATTASDATVLVNAHLLRARAQWETGRPTAVLATLDDLGTLGLTAIDDLDVAVLRVAALCADPLRLGEAHELLDPVRRALVAGERPDLAVTVIALLLELDDAADAAELVDLHAQRDTTGTRAPVSPSPATISGVAFAAIAARVLLEVGRTSEARRHVDAAVEHAEAAPLLTRDALMADALAATAKVLLHGEFAPDRALTVAQQALAAAVRAGTPRVVYDTEFTLARACTLIGDLHASLRWARTMLSDGVSRAHHQHRELGLVGVVLNATVLGDMALLAGALAELDTSSPHLDRLPWIARARALEHGLLHGDRRGALEVIRHRAEAAESRGALLGAAGDWFDFASFGQDEVTAREAATRLRAIASRCDSPLIALWADHLAARADRDLAALSTVVDRWDERGGTWYARRAALDAVDIAQEDGPPPKVHATTIRFEEITRRCPQILFPTPTARALTPLTRREREIADLAAAGSTSADIAVTLVLSIRTVDNHLGRIYTKLGVTGRNELPDALRF